MTGADVQRMPSHDFDYDAYGTRGCGLPAAAAGTAAEYRFERDYQPSPEPPLRQPLRPAPPREAAPAAAAAEDVFPPPPLASSPPLSYQPSRPHRQVFVCYVCDGTTSKAGRQADVVFIDGAPHCTRCHESFVQIVPLDESTPPRHSRADTAQRPAGTPDGDRASLLHSGGGPPAPPPPPTGRWHSCRARLAEAYGMPGSVFCVSCVTLLCVCTAVAVVLIARSARTHHHTPPVYHAPTWNWWVGVLGAGCASVLGLVAFVRRSELLARVYVWALALSILLFFSVSFAVMKAEERKCKTQCPQAAWLWCIAVVCLFPFIAFAKYYQRQLHRTGGHSRMTASYAEFDSPSPKPRPQRAAPACGSVPVVPTGRV